MTRRDDRKNDELRPLKFTCNFSKKAHGSVLVELGDTKVLVTAMIEDKVPPFLEGTNKGWLTAEYSLLPGSTNPRYQREVNKGRPSGRTSEIQRLIGRSLRAAFDLNAIGQRTITIDADVISADASTRVASICGGYVAIYKALENLKKRGLILKIPLLEPVAAVSAGVVNKEVLLDLSYSEDSQAEVDSNIVMNQSGKIIELQMTAEGKPFEENIVSEIIKLARRGIQEIIQKQIEATAKICAV
ncbi:MAG: ribonuclease PH [Candidatus Melainabacteria bacterium]|nr:ribonuclease PH [Candidatus Melainabacteria bacterium]